VIVESDNTDVVMVEKETRMGASAVLTALAPGTANITVRTVNGKTDTAVVTVSPQRPPEPPTVPNLAAPSASNPSSFKPGDKVELYFTLNSDYDMTTLDIDGAPFSISPVVTGSAIKAKANADLGNVLVSGIMPDHDVTFSILAKKIADGLVYKSEPIHLSADKNTPSGGGGGGCDAWLAGSAMLLALPFLRKRGK